MSPPPALVTYGWCRVSYVIAHSLHRRGVPVDVSDASALAMLRVSRATRSFTRTRDPFTDPDGFAADVAELCRARGTAVLVPGHDDLGVLARAEITLGGTRMVAPPPASLDVARSKLATARAAAAAGVRVPRTWRPTDAEELDQVAAEARFPLVVKPQVGNSAKGVSIVADADALRRAHRHLVETHGLVGEAAPIVQEYADGLPVGVAALYVHGEPRVTFCERYLTAKDDRYGTSVLRESIHEPALVEAATRVLGHLGWHGVAHLDFQWTPGEEPVLLEINPRFWGALDLAVRSGVDFPWLLYRLALDGDVEGPTDHRVGVRSRWAAGELIRFAHRAGRLDLRPRRPPGGRRGADGWDDLRRGDPLPLLVEALYYARGMLAGGTNPVREGMLG